MARRSQRRRSQRLSAIGRGERESGQEARQRRCEELLGIGLPKLIEQGWLSFDTPEVTEYYKTQFPSMKGESRRQKFFTDCKAICSQIQDAAKLLSPLCWFLPRISLSEGRLSVSARHYAQIHQNNTILKRALAHHLVSYKAENSWLLPSRDLDEIHLGYGSTVYAVAESMLSDKRFSNVTVCTCNMDIAVMVYLACPRRFASGIRHFNLCNLHDVSWITAGLTNVKRNPNVAVVSFDCIDKSGNLYSDQPQHIEWTTQAINETETVIVIGDHTKFRNPTGTEMKINKNRIDLFTDRQPPSDFNLDRYRLHIAPSPASPAAPSHVDDPITTDDPGPAKN